VHCWNTVFFAIVRLALAKGGKIMKIVQKLRFCSKTFQELSSSERESITVKAILRQAGGNIHKAAKLLGIPVFTLLRRIIQTNGMKRHHQIEQMVKAS